VEISTSRNQEGHQRDSREPCASLRNCGDIRIAQAAASGIGGVGCVTTTSYQSRLPVQGQGLSNAELFGVLLHVVSKFCGLLSRFAHRDRDASTKVGAGLVQPFARGAFAPLTLLGDSRQQGHLSTDVKAARSHIAMQVPGSIVRRLR
jgi:hypothetical protein